MKKNILSLVLVTLLAFPVVALAQCTTATNDIIIALGNITTALQSILYVVAGLFIVLAAFNFITAGGDVEKVKTARMYVLYALVGVIVAVLSGALVDLICDTLI